MKPSCLGGQAQLRTTHQSHTATLPLPSSCSCSSFGVPVPKNSPINLSENWRDAPAGASGEIWPSGWSAGLWTGVCQWGGRVWDGGSRPAGHGLLEAGAQSPEEESRGGGGLEEEDLLPSEPLRRTPPVTGGRRRSLEDWICRFELSGRLALCHSISLWTLETESKIPIKIRKPKAKKLEHISQNIASVLVKFPNLQQLGKRAFVTYLKSVYLRSDKEVFDLSRFSEEKFAAYAASLGLHVTPKIRFVSHRENVQKKDMMDIDVKRMKSNSKPEVIEINP